MPLNLQEKQKIVNEIKSISKGALSAVVADFRGVTAEKITSLRKAGHHEDVYMRIVRNTLIYRAIADTPFSCLKDMFFGPTLIAFSYNNPGAAARLFQSFAKENTSFVIKVASFEGKIIQGSQINRLATLPNYEEAIIRLISFIKEISIGKLVRTLTALRDQKESV